MSVFAVVVKDPAAPPLAPAVFLSGVKGFTMESAREHLRSQPGFLARGVALAAAEELRAAAAAAGIETMLVAESEIPCAPQPLSSVKISLTDDGFYSTAAGAITFIAYKSILIFSAGAFDAPVQPPGIQALKTSLFSKISKALPAAAPAPAEPRMPRETFFRADILAEDGLLRLCLEPENIDFSPLGAERSPSSLLNFRTLLGKISAPALNAVKNAFLPAFISGGQLTNLKLASAAACYTEFTRLMLFKRR